MSNPQHATEDCRREVLRYLAERLALAFPAHAIQRKLRIDGSIFTLEEIEAALVFLLRYPDRPLISEQPDCLGATSDYQATTAGVLFHERSR